MLSPQQSQTQALLITVSTQTLTSLRRSIHGCDNCSDNAQVPFEQLLERLAGCFASKPDYVFTEELRCPSCLNSIEFSSFIEVQDNARVSIARASA